MPTQTIALITDSTCDVPQALIEQYAITVLPLVLIWNGQPYRDRIDLQPEEFYRRLSTEKTLPTTSQVAVVDFAAAFAQAQAQGADAVVAVLLNSQFSGTYQAACQAAETAPLPVYVHDSLNATMGLGWQVLAAARARAAGGGPAEMLAAAEAVRGRVQLFIALDTLEYVYRGGRIGNARRLVGSMLNVKPLLWVDPAVGIVEPAGMAMTRRKSLDLLYSKFMASVPGDGPLHVAVMHGDAAAEAAVLYERIRQEQHPVELLTDITCPTLGINTGPQTVALCGYRD